MTTATLLPQERTSVKPARSMTHPLRDPKTNETGRKLKHNQPFDPEDLSRRLEAHLADQKLKTKRLRDSRVAKAAAAAQDQVYHHVPKVAAAAFERTTSPEAMRQVHKLAQPAVKAHLDLLTLDDKLPGEPVTSLKRTQALDQAIIERDLLRNRNQFQWDQVMEEAAEADRSREVYKPLQRTFVTGFARLRGKTDAKQKLPRPFSTGDLLSLDHKAHATTSMRMNMTQQQKAAAAAYDMHDRNDWAQLEEEVESNGSEEKRTLALRKKQSGWIMMGKKPAKPDKEKDGPPREISSSLQDGSKGGKASFFAMFKRHPS